MNKTEGRNEEKQRKLEKNSATPDCASMPGKPFQSKLEPFVETIQVMRRQRKTWQSIADHLTKLGCSTAPGSLYNFFKRWKRRPYALGMEPEGYGQLSGGPVSLSAETINPPVVTVSPVETVTEELPTIERRGGVDLEAIKRGAVANAEMEKKRSAARAEALQITEDSIIKQTTKSQ